MPRPGQLPTCQTLHVSHPPLEGVQQPPSPPHPWCNHHTLCLCTSQPQFGFASHWYGGTRSSASLSRHHLFPSTTCRLCLQSANCIFSSSRRVPTAYGYTHVHKCPGAHDTSGSLHWPWPNKSSAYAWHLTRVEAAVARSIQLSRCHFVPEAVQLLFNSRRAFPSRSTALILQLDG